MRSSFQHKTMMTLQETLSDGLSNKDFSDCLQQGINPNGNAPGLLLDMPIEQAEKWADLGYDVAVKASQTEGQD